MTDPSTAVRSRAWVEVDLDALRKNALRVQRAAGPGVGLVPMLKADAYGLGMERVAAALAQALPRGALFAFGVAAVAEGERLRAAGWTGRVLVFSPIAPGEYPRAAAASLTLCVSELEALDRWVAAAQHAGAAREGDRLAFHLEVDTGMGRAGLDWREAAAWGAEIARRAGERLHWEGTYTHFHSADEPDLASAHEQWRRFREALAELPPEREGQPRRLVHAANSAAALRLGRLPWDLVRPGIFLYGGGVGAPEQPEPVVSVHARIALVKEVPAGSTVGYGATHRARAGERWGTLTIGYGDGLRRSLAAAGGGALVRGRRVPLVGRISMDMTVAEVTAVTAASVGDVATLIGRQGVEEISLDEVATRCGTISYEVLTGLTPRLPRLYVERDTAPAGSRGAAPEWPREAT